MYKDVIYWGQDILLKVDEIKNMFDYKILYYFLCYILIFILGSILIVRFSRLMSYLFFSNDYHTEHFGELERDDESGIQSGVDAFVGSWL